jgi:glyoxylase-like metal-dependent hydrolase (beta-lactamase superfamily II)
MAVAMLIQLFPVGRLLTNCYVISCDQTRATAIIDPGFDVFPEAAKIFQFIDNNNLVLKLVINTHGHPDHTCGNRLVVEKFHVPISIHYDDAPLLGRFGERITRLFGFQTSSPPANHRLQDGDVVRFGRVILKVMHTPGHSRGSVSLLGSNEVFTGDTLFSGFIGRTDLPGSSGQDMVLSLNKLAMLPEHFVVYPGHGPITTIGQEKKANPFFQSVGRS